MPNVEEVVNFLDQHKLRLTLAESCTAGMVASLIATVSGCGSVLEFGYVVYSERAKHLSLGVHLQTIKTFGLTSEEVAKEMALGALERSQADIAIAITGTAESDDELNGVVCFAYALNDNGLYVLGDTVRFDGDRNEVRTKAANHAISALPDFYNRLIKLE